VTCPIFGQWPDTKKAHLWDQTRILTFDPATRSGSGRHFRGREYAPTGTPEQVNVHDFPDKELGKAIPYGIYDVSASTGWVSVGTDHDTSAFAVATLRTWWDTMGRARYPGADRYSSAPTVAGPTNHGSGPGRSSSQPSPSIPGWR